jgi:inorganic triphosphatase YgiF
MRRAGAALRLRSQDDVLLATYKDAGTLDADGTRRRVEIEEPLVGEREAHPAFRAARGHTTDPLLPLGALENERAVYAYASAEASCEVAVDRLRYPDGSRETRLEVEGPDAGVAALSAALEAALDGLEPARTSKAEELVRRSG